MMLKSWSKATVDIKVCIFWPKMAALALKGPSIFVKKSSRTEMCEIILAKKK